MSKPNTDRQLLFAILAMHLGFISRDDLVAATGIWLENKSNPLHVILRERGAVSDNEHDLLMELVTRHLQLHGNDSQKSLAAISVSSSIRNELQLHADPELDASLARISVAGRDDTPILINGNFNCERFRIVSILDKGGIGDVFIARDNELRRDVALKQIQPRFANDNSSRTRFIAEAEITGRLEHPGIVPVYGFGQYQDGRPFYAMRLIKGNTFEVAIQQFYTESRVGEKHETSHDLRLSNKVQRRSTRFDSVEFRRLLGHFVAVCNTVEYAHSRGVLHRDLKPRNIMIGSHGETLVVDWGLAMVIGRQRVAEPSQESTIRLDSNTDTVSMEMGSVFGTPAFMSPEQASGNLEILGPASDVYNLGATLYYLITGQTPFGKPDSLSEILKRVVKGDFPPPRIVQPQVPKGLEAICLKAMAMDAKDRYISPRGIADDIDNWMADELVSSCPEGLQDRLRRWVRGHAGLTIASTFILLLSFAVSSMSYLGSQRLAELEEDKLTGELIAQSEYVDDLQTAMRQLENRTSIQIERMEEQLQVAAMDVAEKEKATVDLQRLSDRYRQQASDLRKQLLEVGSERITLVTMHRARTLELERELKMVIDKSDDIAEKLRRSESELARTEAKLDRSMAYLDATVRPDGWIAFSRKSILGEQMGNQARELLSLDEAAAQKNFDTAEKLLIEGYDGLRKMQSTIPPQARDQIVAALKRLVEFYTGWGKLDKAEEWKKRLEEVEAAQEPSE